MTVTCSSDLTETRVVLTALKQMLEAAGSSLDKVVKVNVLMASMLEATPMNDGYVQFRSDGDAGGADRAQADAGGGRLVAGQGRQGQRADGEHARGDADE